MPELSTSLEEESLGFWRRISLVLTFFVLAPITLVVSLFSYVSLKNQAAKQPVALVQGTNGVRIFASLPNTAPSFSGEIVMKDARPAILAKYMDQYNSPLTSYAPKIVEIADKYKLDPRLLVAIAQQESNLCKIIPYGSYNCWGWGITSVSSLAFKSYEEGIETVAQGLRENYLDKGYTTPEEIMSKYTPSSPGTWAAGVSAFIAQMQ